MKKILILAILCLIPLSGFAYTQGKTYKITVLHTNDHHGHFWPNSEGELGLAARATLIKELRSEIQQEGGHVILLDAGDVNTGVPQSDLQKAEPDFRGMAKLGYDAMAIGNHEFDNPLSVIRQQQSWGGFPFISANIYVERTGKRLFPSHIEKNFEGLKIGIFGLTTEDTPLKTNRANTRGLTFTKAYVEAKKLVPHLRKKSDILIALTHTGHHPNESHGKDAPGDVTIAKEAPGIDLIVGGHTQSALFKPDIVNGTIIVQAQEWGKYVGRVDLEFLDGKLILKNSQLIPVNLKTSGTRIKQDSEMQNLLQLFKAKGDSLIAEAYKGKDLGRELGIAEAKFIGERDQVRSGETNLGNMITRAYQEKFKADLAVTNSGGIRNSLLPGKVTYESLMNILPFKGQIVTANLKGSELKKYLSEIVLTMSAGSGSFPQFSNLQVMVDKQKREVAQMLVAGKPIKDNENYLVALPEFIATGGDKYPVLKYEKHGVLDVEILRDFVVQRKVLSAKEFKPTGYIQYK